MNEARDLRRLLQAWPYDPDKDMRLVEGEDQRPLLQVRTPLGIEQYELSGRPDGVRPHQFESLLDYHEHRLNQARSAGQPVSFDLTPLQCSELFEESTLYYFRYVRLFQLKDWPRTLRDTERNLRAFDFVHRHARRPEDQLFLEKWRPYVLRIHGSARAMHELEGGAFDQALDATNLTIEAIEGLEELEEETFQFERERSLRAMRELAQQLQRNRPLSELEQLEQQLRQAVERQQFEHAARLRDRIRALRTDR